MFRTCASSLNSVQASQRYGYVPAKRWKASTLNHLRCFSNTPALFDNDNRTLPKETQVVICGGGVVGTSVAYHLAERGWKDVVLLEQGSLTCGTTWHAAGNIGRAGTSRPQMKIVDYSRRLYKKLEDEGHGVGWKECGSLNVAQTKDRFINFKFQQDTIQSLGIESHLLTPAEAKKMCPILRTDDIVGAMYVPSDGVVSAPDVAITLAKLAKEKGVKIFENVTVEQVRAEDLKVNSVLTSLGEIKTEVFVNCAGQWAREVGKRTVPVKVKAPLHSCEHYYLVTKPQEGIDRMMPVIRDYDGLTYFREWSGGILAGGFETNAKPCFHKGIPDRFEFQLLQEDWDHFQILLDSIINRIPMLETAEVRQLTNGPESFTPDSRWLIGQSWKVKNYFIAAGMNSKGIAGAGGVGKHLADWIIDGHSSLNMWSFDVRRFVRLHNNNKFLRDRVGEALADHYVLKYPKQEYVTGRKLRCSPLHTRQEVAGAVFGETMAYERAMYFRNPEDDLDFDTNSMWSYSKPSWLRCVQEEYWAAKERICIMDMSSFTKIEVWSKGNEATEFLQYLCSNNIDNEIGTIVHTGMQNERGGFENDCTVAKLDENHYYIICPATQQTRSVGWLKSHRPMDGNVHVADVTSMYSGIALIGPHAQQLLADVGEISTLKKDFKPMTVATIDVGHASNVRAMRLTHTGEDGFILYIPSEYALHVYDTLMEAGKDYGIRNAGYYALRHLRIENFFAFWGLDLTDDVTPLECGRGFRTKLDDPGDFIGKAALLKQREVGVPTRFTQFLLEDFDYNKDVWPWGGEPIFRDGQLVGTTTTTGYGFSLDKMVCLGFVGDKDKAGNAVLHRNINDWVLDKKARYEISIAGTKYPATPGIYTPKVNMKNVEPLFIPAPHV